MAAAAVIAYETVQRNVENILRVIFSNTAQIENRSKKITANI